MRFFERLNLVPAYGQNGMIRANSKLPSETDHDEYPISAHTNYWTDPDNIWLMIDVFAHCHEGFAGPCGSDNPVEDHYIEGRFSTFDIPGHAVITYVGFRCKAKTGEAGHMARICASWDEGVHWMTDDPLEISTPDVSWLVLKGTGKKSAHPDWSVGELNKVRVRMSCSPQASVGFADYLDTIRILVQYDTY